MKKMKFLCYLALSMLIFGCGSDDSVADSDGGIVADFSFTNEDNLFKFTNLSQGATSYRWDLGNLSFYCDKENPSYRYTTVGGDIKVTLTAINDLGQEASVTKTITAPEVYDIEIAIDGNFDDWVNVPLSYDESASDGGSMQKVKIWGIDENIHIYIEGNTTMLMEIVDIFIDADGDATTGFLSWQWPEGSGADFLFEGPLLSNSWGSFYQHSDPNGGWDWAALAGSSVNISSSGIVNIDEETNGIEFSIPKSQFGSVGSTFSFAITELTAGWAAVASFPEVTATSSFITYEFPVEDGSFQFCE